MNRSLKVSAEGKQYFINKCIIYIVYVYWEPGFDFCPQMGDMFNVVQVGWAELEEAGGFRQKGN